MKWLMIILALACAAYGEDVESLSVPLSFKTQKNTVSDGNFVRLRREYAQQRDEPIVFEAEEATRLELRESSLRIQPDEEASGGFYVEHAKMMQYHFTVATAGTYQVRFRAWFPLKAFYCHMEYMDDGAAEQIADSPHGEPQQWWWTTGRTYELAAGKHTYVLPSPFAFCAGARLDKVAFLPVDQADIEGIGPLVTPITTPDQGTAITKRISLRRITAWELAYETIANGGTAAVEYSYDGTTWQPVPAATSLRPPTPKPRFLYFRVSLKAQPDGISPWVRGLALKAEVIKLNLPYK